MKASFLLTSFTCLLVLLVPDGCFEAAYDNYNTKKNSNPINVSLLHFSTLRFKNFHF